jgi:hypothetical protein
MDGGSAKRSCQADRRGQRSRQPRSAKRKSM